jgi:hypothetical protein
MDDREREVAGVVWKATAGGTDHCVLSHEGGRWLLRGRANGEIGWLGPVFATYEVDSDASWVTVAARVEVADDRRLLVRREPDGRWLADGEEVPVVDGCDVVDLGFTPATNTCAIGRLALPIGASAEIDAAWVRFPELVVERLPQRYTRTGERSYVYESGEFRADLEVDEHGLVVRYDDIWEAPIAGA